MYTRVSASCRGGSFFVVMMPGMKRNIRVYVAGASADVERAQRVMRKIEETEGLENSLDWTVAVVESKVEDSEIGDGDRARYAAIDLNEVEKSDVFLMLADDRPIGRGMYVELGVAQQVRHAHLSAMRGGMFDLRPMVIVVSGGERSSIFTTPSFALGRDFVNVEFGTADDDAAVSAIATFAAGVQKMEDVLVRRERQRLEVLEMCYDQRRDMQSVAMPPRPTFTSFKVEGATLITSFAKALMMLGDSEANALAPTFKSGAGDRGIWAIPHPESLVRGLGSDVED